MNQQDFLEQIGFAWSWSLGRGKGDGKCQKMEMSVVVERLRGPEGNVAPKCQTVECIFSSGGVCVCVVVVAVAGWLSVLLNRG